MKKEDFYFVQFTDIHIGSIVNPDGFRQNLLWALEEVHRMEPRPQMILCTGDCVCNGSRCELEEFKRIMETSEIPYAALPANHDLWGEKDSSVWEELIGPLRKSCEAGNFKFLLWNDIKRIDGRWTNEFTCEDQQWLISELEDAGSRGLQVIAGVHNPPDVKVSRWTEKDMEKLFDLLASYGVKALISGDYHVSDCWERRGLLSINTASLSGFIWNGRDNFPVKPGYRLFHWDGEQLRTFWREGSYWQLPPLASPETKTCVSFPTYDYTKCADGTLRPVMSYEKAQISLSSIGGVWTGGPRPLVRPMLISGKTVLHADTFSGFLEIENVSWSIDENNWYPMRKVWSGIWDEWEADFDPYEYRGGEFLCRVRAEIKGGCDAIFQDNVPIVLRGLHNAPRGQEPVTAGGMQAHFSLRIPFD